MSIPRKKKESISDFKKDWMHLNVTAQQALEDKLELLRRQRTHFVIQHNDKRKEIKKEFHISTDILEIENSAPTTKGNSPRGVIDGSQSNRTPHSVDSTHSKQSSADKLNVRDEPPQMRVNKVRIKDPEAIQRQRTINNQQSFHKLLSSHKDRYHSQCLMAAALSVSVERPTDAYYTQAYSQNSCLIRSKTLFEEFESIRQNRKQHCTLK